MACWLGKRFKMTLSSFSDAVRVLHPLNHDLKNRCRRRHLLNSLRLRRLSFCHRAHIVDFKSDHPVLHGQGSEFLNENTNSPEKPF
jgi:hypothetical protein